MRFFGIYLAIGLAALTAIQAGDDHRKPERKTTLATVHTVDGRPKPLSPKVPFPIWDGLPPNTVYKARTVDPILKTLSPSVPFPTQDGFPPQARANHPHPFPDGPGGFPKPQSPPSVDPRDVAAETDPELNDTAKMSANDIEVQTSNTPVSHTIVKLPDGPAGYTYTQPHSATTHTTKTFEYAPDGPAGFTQSHTWSSPHETILSKPRPHTIHPVERPNGPAGYSHIKTHPTSPPILPRNFDLEDTSTFTLRCTGSSLSSPVRTCYGKNIKNTLLTGSWCAANCKCNNNGCMSCDSSKAAGCTNAVVTDTCKAVVRDWNCFCQGQDGTQSYC